MAATFVCFCPLKYEKSNGGEGLRPVSVGGASGTVHGYVNTQVTDDILVCFTHASFTPLFLYTPRTAHTYTWQNGVGRSPNGEVRCIAVLQRGWCGKAPICDSERYAAVVLRIPLSLPPGVADGRPNPSFLPLPNRAALPSSTHSHAHAHLALTLAPACITRLINCMNM